MEPEKEKKKKTLLAQLKILESLLENRELFEFELELEGWVNMTRRLEKFMQKKNYIGNLKQNKNG